MFSNLPGRGLKEGARSLLWCLRKPLCLKSNSNGLMKVYWMVRLMVAVWMTEPPVAVTFTA
jgi:hypothetical protein